MSRFNLRARTRRRALVIEFTYVEGGYWRLIRFLSEGRRSPFFSTNEARAARDLSKDQRVLARYFARYSREIFAREAK